MSLGTELSAEFKRQYATMHPYGEVALFRTLIDTFLALRCYDIAEIHGKRTIVQYTEDQGWFTKAPRCELGDIFFLVYSPSRKRARYFVMQNKIQPKKSCVEIHANLVQHELLATKKCFEYVKNHRTSHMLDSAIRDSVCVYGNFYNTAPGMMNDMAVFTASKLVFKGSVPCFVGGGSPTKEVEYRGLMDDIFSMSVFSRDFEGTDNLQKFGDLVEGLYIGETVSRRVMYGVVDMLLTLPGESFIHNAGKTASELCDELEGISVGLDDIPQERYDIKVMDRCKEIIIINGDRRYEDGDWT